MDNMFYDPKVVKLFEYFGLRGIDLLDALEQMHFWTFVISLSQSFVQFDKLTEPQYSSLKKHFDKRRFKTLDYYIQQSESKYRRDGSSDSDVVRKTIVHNYGNLVPLSIYDLPFEEDEIIEAEFAEFSKSMVVMLYAGRELKIPKPTWMDRYGTHEFKYHRTRCKGFLIPHTREIGR